MLRASSEPLLWGDPPLHALSDLDLYKLNCTILLLCGSTNPCLTSLPLPVLPVLPVPLAELLVQLSVNQPPSIKQYQEAIVAHLALQHPTFLQELLLPQISSVEKGGAATGSHILIAVQVALHSPQEQQLALLPQLLRLLLPWTNHHTHHIRTFAQLGFCALLVSFLLQRYWLLRMLYAAASQHVW